MIPNHIEKILHDIKRNTDEDPPVVSLSMSNGDEYYGVTLQPLDITWDLLVMTSRSDFPPIYVPASSIVCIWPGGGYRGVG